MRRSVRGSASVASAAVIVALLNAPTDAQSGEPNQAENRDQAIVNCMVKGTAECNLEDYEELDSNLWPPVTKSDGSSETLSYFPTLSGPLPAEAFLQYANPDWAGNPLQDVLRSPN